ncbi:MAG: response regulator [Planctomycetota bacterium]
MSSDPGCEAARILIVDDDPHMCLVLTKALGRGRAEIDVCHDGNEALKRVRHFKPHVVLLDYMLPRMDGFKVLRLLKGDARLRDTRVILMTASAEDEVSLEAQASGADGFLNKPLDLATVLRVVKSVVPQF